MTESTNNASAHKDAFDATSTQKTGTFVVRVYAGSSVGSVPVMTYTTSFTGGSAPFGAGIITGPGDLAAGSQYTAQAYQVSTTGTISNTVVVTFTGG